MNQVLDYDSLKKEQKLSIQAIKALLRTYFYKVKYFINITVINYNYNYIKYLLMIL